MLEILLDFIGKKINEIVWRRRNRDNYTYLCCRTKVDINRIKVGKATYGGINVLDSNEQSMLKIGCYCSIASNVAFLLGTEHNLHTISTYPFKVKLLHTLENEATTKGDIIIDDDVWIGYGVTILSGVHIGQGAVIAAGAVVSKDVPPYAIVGGIPAKVIKYRFSDEIIKELLKVNYANLNKELVSANVDKMYQKLKNKEQLEWLKELH